MLAVTPSHSREVALIVNPEFEAGSFAGIEPAASSTAEIRLLATHFC